MLSFKLQAYTIFVNPILVMILLHIHDDDIIMGLISTRTTSSIGLSNYLQSDNIGDVKEI